MLTGCSTTTKGEVLLKLNVYDTLSAFEELQEEWNTLLKSSVNNRIFLTYEWQSLWWQAYHPGELWIIAVRNQENDLVGLAPWFIDSEKTVRGIGCVDVTDYLDVIVHQDCVVDVYSALADFLNANTEQFERFDLCNIPSASPTLEHLPQLLEAHGFEISVEQQEVCPVIDLPNEWEAYLGNLDKKQRHEIRRKLRRASGDNIAWYIVDETHDINQELEIFLELMKSANQEKAEFLQNEAHVNFFKRFTPVFFEKGWLQLAFITVDNEPAAAYLNFNYGNEIYVYNSGLNLEVGGVFSTGIVLMANLIRHAIENGYARFDMLRGNEEYKYRMGGKDTEIFELIATK